MIKREHVLGLTELLREVTALLMPSVAANFMPQIDRITAAIEAKPLILAEAVLDQRVIDGTHVIYVDGPPPRDARPAWRFWYRVRHDVIERNETRVSEDIQPRWWGMASLNLPDLVQRATIVEAATVPGVLE